MYEKENFKIRKNKRISTHDTDTNTLGSNEYDMYNGPSARGMHKFLHQKFPGGHV